MLLVYDSFVLFLNSIPLYRYMTFVYEFSCLAFAVSRLWIFTESTLYTCPFIYLGKIPEMLMTASHGKCIFNLFINYQTVFQSTFTILHMSEFYESSNSSISSPIVIITNLFNFSNLNKYVVIPHFFKLVFLLWVMMLNIILCTYLSYVYILCGMAFSNLLSIYFFNSLVQIFIGLLLFSFEKSFTDYVFKSFIRHHFCKYFSQVCG